MTSFLKIADAILDKLTNKHNVSAREVEQSFENRYAGVLLDTRAKHKTIPPTMWFIAPTNRGRRLKVVYILIKYGISDL